jgi:hypothetical protein
LKTLKELNKYAGAVYCENPRTVWNGEKDGYYEIKNEETVL